MNCPLLSANWLWSQSGCCCGGAHADASYSHTRDNRFGWNGFAHPEQMDLLEYRQKKTIDRGRKHQNYVYVQCQYWRCQTCYGLKQCYTPWNRIAGLTVLRLWYIPMNQLRPEGATHTGQANANSERLMRWHGVVDLMMMHDRRIVETVVPMSWHSIDIVVRYC